MEIRNIKKCYARNQKICKSCNSIWNYVYQENQRNLRETYQNHENLRIQCDNHENHENLIIQQQIIKS